jgi:hypothetical protein
MPYIKPQDRAAILLNETNIEDAGELNFFITTLINYYIDKNTKCYTTLNEVIGVLECAKLELYRRIVSPYEDIKIQENGDVYTV